MSNRNRPSGIEREIRRRRKRRMAELNRNDHEIFTMMLKITLAALAVIIGICIWFWAAVQQAQEVEAAVLRSHRITDGSMYSWGPGVTPGQNKNCPILVPELPDFPPVDGEPPQAIEIKLATKAEAVPEEQWESLGVFKTTGFCNCKKCCGKWAGGKTKSGVYPEEGITIAVDPKVIPLGSKVMIDGIGVRVAQDTGKHIKGKCIDVYYKDHGTAWNHGEQYHEVFVLR